MKICTPDAESIAEAAAAIRCGEIVAYPTETVYGLGVDPFSEEAIARLKRCKGRPETNPMVLIISDTEQMEAIVDRVSPLAEMYMRAFWPGPLSLVLPRASSVPDSVAGGSAKVSVRCPGCMIARALCASVGHAVTSTSANRSGESPAMRIEDVQLPDVAVGLDGGVLTQGIPSTVYDPDTGEVFREGAIGRVALEELRSR